MTKNELCVAVTLHAAAVRNLMADIRSSELDSATWRDAVSALAIRAEYLANRADELAQLCKEQN